MFYFYVLYSLKDHQLYKGYTSEIAQRFERHQAGKVTATKHRRPLILIHLEAFDNRTEVMRREKEAKQAQAAIELKKQFQKKGILDEHSMLAIADMPKT